MTTDPMVNKKHILLGKIVKMHGFDGTVIVRTDNKFSGRIKESEPVFLIVEGKPVPFFIASAEQTRPGSLLIKFDGYNTPDSVKEFTGCEITIPVEPDSSPVLPDNEDLTGFLLFSSEGEEIGTVTGLISNPGQYLLRIAGNNNTELLIPLHEDLIVGIDPASKFIRMIIPDGLTEINS
jgi:16S rRNA processing protein RimM